jgi:serine/threonine protein kinase
LEVAKLPVNEVAADGIRVTICGQVFGESTQLRKTPAKQKEDVVVEMEVLSKFGSPVAPTRLRALSDLVKDFDSMITKRKLGEGGFGAVTLVEDPENHDLIALKSFHRNVSGSGGDITGSFTKEIDMLMKLVHPCVLEIVGYSLPTPTVPARIGTMFAANGSLREALDERRSGRRRNFMDDTGIAIIIAGIVAGMRFIHSRGVIHRDVKPGNILIDERGYVRIGDLGSSRLVSLDVTQTKQVGTALYMAPEMYEDGVYDASADVFSFALIVYELVVGDYVFPPRLAPMVLMKKVASSQRPKLPDDMNITVKKMILRCWSVDPMIRESFDEIWCHLSRIKFQITPQVDSSRVEEFLSWVEANESK